MAEDEDSASNKKTSLNSNNLIPSQENEENATKPDLGIEETKNKTNENDETLPAEPSSSSSKSTGATRKEENPFSFRHFLKRDLSLPGNSTYENTGARPKVYANTVQHSPTKLDVHADSRRDKTRPTDTYTKEKGSGGSNHRISDNTSSSSSVEIPFSVVDNSDSKQNFYTDNNDVPFYHRPNIASEPLGMPSLPDFVQDHILVEQAYLSCSGSISVDLDNLPDFTFNTNFNAGSSSSLGRRNNSCCSGNRGYNYESCMGAPSTSNDPGHSGRSVPLDLPSGAEVAGAMPLDLPPHLSLDLTESVNPADRRNTSPRSTFPLDLPPNAGAESMRLPDFLPVHPGRTSPEPEHQNGQLIQIMSELERLRLELFSERSRRHRAEEDAEAARLAAEDAGTRLRMSQHTDSGHPDTLDPILIDSCSEAARADIRYIERLQVAGANVSPADTVTASTSADTESTVSKLKKEIKKLKEELAASREEVRTLRNTQARAANDLRRAGGIAETSLRELLAGLEQLKNLSSTLDPT